MQACTTVSISKVTLYLYTDFTQNDWLYHKWLTIEKWDILHSYAEYSIMLGMIRALHTYYARKDTVLMLSVHWSHVEEKNKYKYLLASLKTGFPLCHWSIFSSVYPLDAGKILVNLHALGGFRNDISGSQDFSLSKSPLQSIRRGSQESK